MLGSRTLLKELWVCLRNLRMNLEMALPRDLRQAVSWMTMTMSTEPASVVRLSPTAKLSPVAASVHIMQSSGIDMDATPLI